MQPISDLLTDRKRLKAQLSSWRALALLAIAGSAAYYVAGFGPMGHSNPGRDYIAQITIEGIMTDDPDRDAMMKEILEDDRAKALIVRLDSPGGTTVGGEEIYLQLKAIAAKKPVVGIMRTVCASACYMASLGTTHVIARDSTLTGSIGVLLEAVEVSKLAEKLDITPITIKSGAYKDAPSLTTPFTDDQRQVVKSIVDDAYSLFVSMIVERRKMDAERVRELADGRVYTGRQAAALGLIDGIGGEAEVRAWLTEKHKINQDLEIEELTPQPQYESLFDQLSQYTSVKIFGRDTVALDGLVSIWHPSAMH